MNKERLDTFCSLGGLAFMIFTQFALHSTGDMQAMLAGVPWMLCLVLVLVLTVPHALDVAGRGRDAVQERLAELRSSGQLPAWLPWIAPVAAVLAYGYAGFVKPGQPWIAVVGALVTLEGIVRKLRNRKVAA